MIDEQHVKSIVSDYFSDEDEDVISLITDDIIKSIEICMYRRIKQIQKELPQWHETGNRETEKLMPVFISSKAV